MSDNNNPKGRIDLDKPRYDQSTYMGRAKHFFQTANPLNVFASNAKLEAAARLVKEYRAGSEPANTTREEVYAAKSLYESAYHPGTGEKMILIGIQLKLNRLSLRAIN